MTEQHQEPLFAAGPSGSAPRQGRRRAARKQATPKSDHARLCAIVKSARDSMRTDEGLNGDLDRLPQLAALLFLRCFDAHEAERKILGGRAVAPATNGED